MALCWPQGVIGVLICRVCGQGGMGQEQDGLIPGKSSLNGGDQPVFTQLPSLKPSMLPARKDGGHPSQ